MQLAHVLTLQNGVQFHMNNALSQYISLIPGTGGYKVSEVYDRSTGTWRRRRWV